MKIDPINVGWASWVDTTFTSKKCIVVFQYYFNQLWIVQIWLENLEAEIKVKPDPDEFFHSFGGKAHQPPNLCSDKVHGVNLHEGDWKTEGSVKHWTYAIGNKN